MKITNNFNSQSINNQPLSPFQEAMETLFRRKQWDSAGSASKVVILGAGPAGLLRAIESLIYGNETIVIEKRAENAQGRCNAVELKPETISLLKEYGIYQYLIENELIFPENEGYMHVRLEDLEEAMTAVINELSPQPIIRNGMQVTELHQDSRKVAITLTSSSGTLENIYQVDLIVNTEGARSTTNALLGNRRFLLLSKIPVIAAIFKDERETITDCSSFFKYVGQTLLNLITAIYYHAIFLFMFIFQGEKFWNENRTIAGAVILKTPGQNYVGCGFNQIESDHLMKLKRAVEESIGEELEAAQKAYNAYASYWIKIAFCAANFMGMLSAVGSLFGCLEDVAKRFKTASWLPLDSFSVTEIGADTNEMFFQTLNDTIILTAGDAAATVDPSTGLGCNFAILTIENFRTDILEKLKTDRDVHQMNVNYDLEMTKHINYIHSQSYLTRKVYRPDEASFYKEPWRKTPEELEQAVLST